MSIAAPCQNRKGGAISSYAIALVYLAYAVGTIAVFALRPPREAAVWAYFGGWLILPVGAYPPFQTSILSLPIQIMGLALPADMPLNKAIVIGLAPCLASLLCDFCRWRTLRPAALDLAIVGWCAWPLLRAATLGEPAAGLGPSAHLSCAWGGSWLLGKLYFSGQDGAAALLKAIGWSGVALAPFAVIEPFTGPVAYALLYGEHPYAPDSVRYIGYRPLAMFEHGNQYGIWIALAAVAAIALAAGDRRWRLIAGGLVVASLAAQSVSAILLLIVGGAVLMVRPRVPLRWGLAATAGVAGAGIVYVSGVIPLERIVRHTALGARLFAALRSVVRDSFFWRVSQDQKVMPLVHQHLLAGWGRWDWWLPVGFRPWGLPMLTVGQFGVIGLLLMVAVVLIAPVLALARNGVGNPVGALALAVLLAAVDAALNAFIFWPALIAAGALANTLAYRPADPAGTAGDDP